MNRLDKLVIVGASGHGKVIADIAKLNGYKEIVFWMIMRRLMSVPDIRGSVLPVTLQKGKRMW